MKAEALGGAEVLAEALEQMRGGEMPFVGDSWEGVMQPRRLAVVAEGDSEVPPLKPRDGRFSPELTPAERTTLQAQVAMQQQQQQQAEASAAAAPSAPAPAPEHQPIPSAAPPLPTPHAALPPRPRPRPPFPRPQRPPRAAQLLHRLRPPIRPCRKPPPRA